MNEGTCVDAPMQGECCAKSLDNRVQKMTYELRVQQLDRGYIVNVGCKSFAFENQEVMLGMITEYITNPNKTEDSFYNGTLFAAK